MTDQKYGFEQAPASAGNGALARVIAVHKERYHLAREQGDCYGRLKASSYFDSVSELFPTVGDFVEIQYNPAGDSVILHTLPRRTFFSRIEPGAGRPTEQAVAANFDTVFVVQSLNENFNVVRLERYLTQAWQSGARPVVVLTKADLPGDHSREILAAQEAAPGVEVLAVSAKTGQGLDGLAPYLKPGETLVFLGSSGVGKSSLLNALAGEELMETGAVRESDSRGRHTTTHRQLFQLPCGAMVIDTPGMRTLGMWDVTDGLGVAFPDVEELLGKCRFSDCRHESEPGCAIQEALLRGELSPERWKSYQKLQREAVFAQGKENFRMRKQLYRSAAKKLRQKKKYDRHG